MATTKNTTQEAVATLMPVGMEALGEKLAAHRISLASLRQILVSYQANLRRSTANTKKRGEVSGGGKKPWRQKGTGRARVGSSRTPVWRGGGIVFGPSTERNYSQHITKTAKIRTLADAIKIKVKAGVVHTAEISEPITKTQVAARMLAPIGTGYWTLIVVPEMSWGRGFTNLYRVRVLTPAQLTAANITTARNIVFIGNTWETTKAKFE